MFAKQPGREWCPGGVGLGVGKTAVFNEPVKVCLRHECSGLCMSFCKQ